ncbi:MAG: PEP-CTERM/exosortase system-associated acyltransferase [Gammaproteobacteria bacterium]|nr:PEP-CTERM/exosortase system-associated acyltransferase [Gammaproteobacteria bacterium]
MTDYRISSALGTLWPVRLFYRTAVGHLFHRYFQVVAADTDALRAEVFRIRYDVYCDELGWEDRARYPDRQETDEYDRYALHSLLLHKPSNTYAGCVRLVQVPGDPPGLQLPFESACRDHLFEDIYAPLARDRRAVGEISRLAVRERFRRRENEQHRPEGQVPERNGRTDPRRRTPPIAMGLYLAAACSGLQAGKEGVFALMEPRLARRLRTYGLYFRQVGEGIEHRGTRAPFYISRDDLYGRISPRVRGFLDVVCGDVRFGGNGR